MKLVAFLCLLSAHLAFADLAFESSLVEVEASASAKRVSAEFNFTNKGDDTVDISHVDPDCSCVSIEIKGGKLKYAPGESGVIRATFEIGNSIGTVDQLVAIWLKGDPKDKPSIKLTARIKIPELVAIRPKSLKWKLGDKAEPRRIHITMNHDQPIIVTKISSSSDNFPAKLETIEVGKRYDIVVEPVDPNTPGIAVVTIDTDCPVKKQQRQQAFAMVLRQEQ